MRGSPMNVGLMAVRVRQKGSSRQPPHLKVAATRVRGGSAGREREAKSKAEAQNWSRVALLIAERTCKRVGLDTASRMASDAIFASSLDSSASPPHAPIRELDPLDELSRIGGAGLKSGGAGLFGFVFWLTRCTWAKLGVPKRFLGWLVADMLKTRGWP